MIGDLHVRKESFHDTLANSLTQFKKSQEISGPIEKSHRESKSEFYSLRFGLPLCSEGLQTYIFLSQQIFKSG
jgi:hypothetical protein